jgi:hypothetical protein
VNEVEIEVGSAAKPHGIFEYVFAGGGIECGEGKSSTVAIGATEEDEVLLDACEVSVPRMPVLIVE